MLEVGGGVADTGGEMCYDVESMAGSEAWTADGGFLSFAAFSLAHAACGDDVVEVRVGEDTLLEWCTVCSVMEIFGPRER